MQHAVKIGEFLASGYMPRGGLAGMSAEERLSITIWVARGAGRTGM